MRFFPLIRLLLAAIIIVIAVAIATRPAQTQLAANMPNALRAAVMKGDFAPANKTVAQGLSDICKVSAKACFELIKPHVTQEVSNRLVYNHYALNGFGRALACYGAFGKIRCGTGAP